MDCYWFFYYYETLRGKIQNGFQCSTEAPFPAEEIKMHANDIMHQGVNLTHSLTGTYTHTANVFLSEEKNLVIHLVQSSNPTQIVFTQGDRLQMNSSAGWFQLNLNG